MNYRNLEVWKRSLDLTADIYRLTKRLPKEELFGLSDQMRRAVISIPSNIAEGAGRNSDKRIQKIPVHCKWFNCGIRNAITYL